MVVPVIVPVTVARRAARRSVVSTAGPSTTIATALVIARPVSKLPVEVMSVYFANVVRFSSRGAPGT